MTVRIRHITVDCAKCYDLSLFWSALTGFRENPDDPNLPEHTEAVIEAPDGSAAMLFVQVPEGKAGKNRIHLDLQPTDATRDEEVQRILGLGATVVGDFRKDDGSGWVTMADPEGNEFCVERSAAERAAS
ncbi:VOC family protein [Dactylosporangium siamense]|uniref:Glyoxalase n=1 Tax=Dactylosporangium siamense TaxID=685454 RepID=A0A919PY70_9ACTN|nr:VOC family protein [Dactylosporangium siamense]GIG50688.1 glyoxalase [Dactylosporangium siamense]